MPRYATPFFVYIVRCADESFYTGMTSDLELRLAEHQEGLEPKADTFSRRPIELVWSQDFPNHDEAFRVERQIKGWSRSKKEALIKGNIEEIHRIVRGEWERDVRRNALMEGAGPEAGRPGGR